MTSQTCFTIHALHVSGFQMRFHLEFILKWNIEIGYFHPPMIIWQYSQQTDSLSNTDVIRKINNNYFAIIAPIMPTM